MDIDHTRKTGQMGSKRARRGQSLVEFALTLPVLLTILAGVVEVANILMIYNRVQLAAREGARFGAMGGTNAGILGVVQQSSTAALQASNDQMKVWVIRPTIQVSGTTWSWKTPATLSPAPGTWSTTAVCVFPLAAPAGPGCADTSPLTPVQVMNDVKNITGTSAPAINGTIFVSTVVQYDADMILRLPWFSPAATNGRFRMWAYAVMQQEVEQTAVAQKSAGCSAYPIALSSTAISGHDTEKQQFMVSLNNEPGSIQGFRFLSWNSGRVAATDLTATGTCQGSLRFPGNSIGCYPPTISPATSFIEPDEPGDTTLHRGDWVLYNPASISGAVYSLLDTATTGHFATERTLRVITYTDEAGVNPVQAGGAWRYRIDGFAVVRLIKDASTSALKFEWVKLDTSCGYAE